MKEKKTWKKRVLSIVLAFALVLTQFGVWNAGKESVQAAENDSFTLYYYNESEEPLYVNIWNWAGLTFAEGSNLNSAFGWKNKQAKMTAVEGNANWYSVTFQIKDAAANDGFTIYQNDSNNEKAKYDNQWNNTQQYAVFVSRAKSGYAIKEGKVYEDLTEAGLNIQDQEEPDQNEANVSEITKDGYTLKLSADKKEVTVGDTITFQVSLEKDGKKITNLQEEGYHIYWWNITMNSESEFVDYDPKAGGYAMTMGMVPQKAGENEIKINLQDSSWNKIIEELKIKVNVKESDSVVKDAAIDVTKTDRELSSDFIMGMDISSMISELDSGVIYRDYKGNQLETLDDICKFLANQGINHIRIRVWNNPYDTNRKGYGGGNNDVAKAKQFADACRKAGIKMLVDFHCSDLWTDPGKQQAPKAWKGYTVEQKAQALTEFITDSLNTIDSSKDVVDMVQVGNETTNGFIGETNQTNMCTLFSAGAQGVKNYKEDVKVVIHLTNPEKENMTAWAKILYENKVNYDILATSYYPYWHGTLTNLATEFKKVKETYNKDVMVAETSYAYTLEDSDGHDNTVRVGNNDTAENTTEPFTEQGQATAIRNLINTVNNAGGLGVYYWEPAWLTVGDTRGLTGDAYDNQVAANKVLWEEKGSGWASSYAKEYEADDAGKWYGGSAVDNEAMFYPNGTASPSLHVWNYVKTGAVSNLVSVEKVGDNLSDTIIAGTTYTLPETLEITYSDKKENAQITWNEADVQKIDTDTPGTYVVNGTVALRNDITRGAYVGKTSADVQFILEVKEKNLFTDSDAAEFDSDENYEMVGKGLKAFPYTENVYSGSHALGWWNTEAESVSATYKKNIALTKGTYTFEAKAMGGAGEMVSLQILDADKQVLYEGQETLTGYAASKSGWQTPSVTFTLTEDKVVTFRVAVDIQKDGWGAVDALYLHGDGSAEIIEPSKGEDSGNSGSSTTPEQPAPPTTPATPEKPSNTTTITKPDGTTSETTKIDVPAPSGNKVEATVNVSKDANGKVTDATANVTNTKPEISTDVAAKIVEAAGTDSVVITTEVTDAKGNTQYTVTVDAKNLTAGNTLKVLAVDKKTGEKKLVNAKSYKVDENGTISVSLPKGCEYQLVTTKEVEKVEKAVLKTVEVKKTSASVKKGKSTKIQLSSKLDMENVKSVTYTTTKKSVVKVAKNGKITAKKKGTAVVKATVTLKSGKKKTVTMKVKVK